MHVLFGTLYVPYVTMQVTCGALIVNYYTYAPPRCRTAQYHTIFIVISATLWNDLGYARATLDKQSCVITSTLFKMNSTCMRSCDLNFSCLSIFITSPEVSVCQNNKRIQIQYGRSCLHFVSLNFNFVNLRQLLGFPCANQLKSVNFVGII